MEEKKSMGGGEKGKEDRDEEGKGEESQDRADIIYHGLRCHLTSYID